MPGRTAIALFVALCAPALFAQRTDTWSRTYGTTWVETVRDLGVTGSGDLIILSDQNGPAVTKLNAAGDIVWNQVVGGFELVAQTQILVMKNGSSIVAGTMIDPEEELYFGFLIHLDPLANLIWAKRYALPSRLLFTNICAVGDGGYLVVGRSPMLETALMIRLTTTGEVQWAKSFDVSGTEAFDSVVPMGDGFLVLGNISGSLWLVSVSATGALRWQKSYRDTYSQPFGAISTTDGGAIIVGHMSDDGLALRIDGKGTPRWQLTFPHAGQERFDSVTQMSDHHFLVGGSANSFGAGNGDVWLVKLTGTGQVLSQRVFGGLSGEGSTSDLNALVRVAATKQGAFVGSITDSLGAGHTDMWLMSVGTDGSGTECGPGTATHIQTRKISPVMASIPIEIRPLPVAVTNIALATTPKELVSGEACFPASALAEAKPPQQQQQRPQPTLQKTPSPPTAHPGKTGETKRGAEQRSAALSPDHSGGKVYLLENADGPFYETLHNLMRKGDSRALEHFASELVRTKARFPTGQWKIRDFYTAIVPGERFNVTPEKYLDLLDSWSRAFPQSPTPWIAKAKFHNELAWDARGSEFADTVTQSGWDEFHRQGRWALEALKRAEKLKPQDPEYFTTLVQVLGAQGASDEAMEAAFLSGVSTEPTYSPLYTRRAHYLTPQWGGDPGDIERLAARGGDRTRAEIGDEIYARLAACCYGPEEAFSKHGFSWPRVRQGFLEILKRFPGSSLVAQWFARMSVAASDRTTARMIFSLAETTWNKDSKFVWENRHQYDEARKWAMEEPAAPQVEASAGSPVAVNPSPSRATPAPPRRWIDDLVKNWPLMVMPVEVTRQDGRKFSGAGFLVRVNEKILAVSSAGLLSTAGTLVDSEQARVQIADLVMRTAGTPLRIGQMVSSPKPREQGIAFTLEKLPATLPVQTLQVRTSPLTDYSAFYVVHCSSVISGRCEQRAYRLSVALHPGGKRVKFEDFQAELKGADAQAADRLAGSPVIDGEGQVVGVLVEAVNPEMQSALKVEELGRVLGWNSPP